jgi:hypothetical protein
MNWGYCRVLKVHSDPTARLVHLTISSEGLDDPTADPIAIAYPVAHWHDQDWDITSTSVKPDSPKAVHDVVIRRKP